MSKERTLQAPKMSRRKKGNWSVKHESMRSTKKANTEPLHTRKEPKNDMSNPVKHNIETLQIHLKRAPKNSGGILWRHAHQTGQLTEQIIQSLSSQD